MIPRRFLILLSVLLACLAGTDGLAGIRLHSLFSDNMVLQTGTSTVWGWGEDGQEVVVEIQDRRAIGKVKNGRWQATLRRLKPGGPFNLKVRSGEEVTALTNVMVGEVWVASGQSNMQWPLRRSYNVTTEIASAENFNLRLFTVPRLKANEPLDNVNGSWQRCHPGSVPEFSAVAYYFGRDLQKALGVPVGIIHSSWGGSPAEVWMSADALESDRSYREEILDPYPKALERFQTRLAEYEAERIKAKENGIEFTKKRPRGVWKPSELFNGMIAPLIPFEIAGAIWYQGEANARRAFQYRSLFPDMIRDWRREWGVGKFPFLLVQLAPFRQIRPQPMESDWAELREAQWLATQELSDVGMAVITDVGEEDDIHPSKKEPVGARLAVAARAIAYGEKITYSGPTYRKMKIRGNKAYITFHHVGKGLEARGGELTGFTIAGSDRKFYNAKASIQGERVVVSSADVPEPEAVRFGWADYPVVNLWNLDGLPASPFRTDEYPMITEPKAESEN